MWRTDWKVQERKKGDQWEATVGIWWEAMVTRWGWWGEWNGWAGYGGAFEGRAARTCCWGRCGSECGFVLSTWVNVGAIIWGTLCGMHTFTGFGIVKLLERHKDCWTYVDSEVGLVSQYHSRQGGEVVTGRSAWQLRRGMKWRSPQNAWDGMRCTRW